MSKRPARIVLAAGAAALTGVLAGSSGFARTSSLSDEIGTLTVGGMKIEAELEEAETMQMLMNGEWIIQQPGKDETHHFEVALVDPAFGGRIPYAKVSATFRSLKTGTTFAKRLDAMYGDNLHYGANVKLTKGRYVVTVRVQPPALMREGEGLNKWLKAVKAQFRFTV